MVFGQVFVSWGIFKNNFIYMFRNFGPADPQNFGENQRKQKKKKKKKDYERLLKFLRIIECRTCLESGLPF